MNDYLIFKCTTCQKLRIHNVCQDFDVGEDSVVVECQGCFRMCVKLRVEEVAMDKDIVRCSGCGAWIIQRQKCVLCEYEKTQKVPHPVRMGGW